MKAQNQLNVRKRADRGHSNFGWLDARYTFSFGDYHNPDWMGFHHLRVMNNDTIQPKGGFPTHSHRDMEILTYILDGSLEHQDSLGNGSVIHAGDFQKMSAGTGVRHSEFNPSVQDSTHLYQIWILPSEQGLKPAYQQVTAQELPSFSGLQLIASPNRETPIQIAQDANLYCGRISSGESTEWKGQSRRAYWLQMVRGKAELNGVLIEAGDGVYAETAVDWNVVAEVSAEFLLFDMGMSDVR